MPFVRRAPGDERRQRLTTETRRAQGPRRRPHPPRRHDDHDGHDERRSLWNGTTAAVPGLKPCVVIVVSVRSALGAGLSSSGERATAVWKVPVDFWFRTPSRGADVPRVGRPVPPSIAGPGDSCDGPPPDRSAPRRESWRQRPNTEDTKDTEATKRRRVRGPRCLVAAVTRTSPFLITRTAKAQTLERQRPNEPRVSVNSVSSEPSVVSRGLRRSRARRWKERVGFSTSPDELRKT